MHIYVCVYIHVDTHNLSTQITIYMTTRRFHFLFCVHVCRCEERGTKPCC